MKILVSGKFPEPLQYFVEIGEHIYAYKRSRKDITLAIIS